MALLCFFFCFFFFLQGFLVLFVHRAACTLFTFLTAASRSVTCYKYHNSGALRHLTTLITATLSFTITAVKKHTHTHTLTRHTVSVWPRWASLPLHSCGFQTCVFLVKSHFSSSSRPEAGKHLPEENKHDSLHWRHLPFKGERGCLNSCQRTPCISELFLIKQKPVLVEENQQR